MAAQPESYPAPTNTRGAPHPRINPDDSITVQLAAPEPKRVQGNPADGQRPRSRTTRHDKRYRTRVHQLHQRRLVELDKAGIRYTYWDTPAVAHKRLIWRRCPIEFVTLFFQNVPG